MERLTDRRTAEQVRENIKKLQAAGFEVSISDLRYVKLADYENEEAIKELREVYENEYPTASGDFDEYASHDVPNVLRNMKAADVQPARFARWIDLDNRILCSGCGAGYDDYDEVKQNTYIFCPNCGARMDGDTNV